MKSISSEIFNLNRVILAVTLSSMIVLLNACGGGGGGGTGGGGGGGGGQAVVQQVPLTVDASEKEGLYAYPIAVFLEPSDPAAKIYFSMDGTSPPKSLYESPPIFITKTTKLFYYAVRGDEKTDIHELNFEIDTVKPTIKFDSSATVYLQDAWLSVLPVDSADIAKIYYSIDATSDVVPMDTDHEYNATTKIALVSVPGDEVRHVIRTLAMDKAGNKSDLIKIDVLMDSKEPTLSVNMDDAKIYKSNLDVLVSSNQSDGKIYYAMGDANVQAPTEASDELAQGSTIGITHTSTLKLLIIDPKSGQKSILTKNYVIDKIPPLGLKADALDLASDAIVSPKGGKYFNQNLRIKLSTADAKDKIYYTTDGTSPSKASDFYSEPILLQVNSNFEEEKVVRVIAYDGVDNATSIEDFKFYIDRKAPTLKFDKSTDPIYTSAFNVLATMSEAGKVYYTKDGSDPRTSMTRQAIELSLDSRSFLIPIDQQNQTTLKIMAFDLAENPIADVVTRLYTIDSIAPIVQISVSPDRQIYGKADSSMSVTLSSSATDLLSTGGIFYNKVDAAASGPCIPTIEVRNNFILPISNTEGKFTICVAGEDQNHNRSSTFSRGIEIDLTSPDITFDSITSLTNVSPQPVVIRAVTKEGSTVQDVNVDIYYRITEGEGTAQDPKIGESGTVGPVKGEVRFSRSSSATIAALAVDGAGNKSAIIRKRQIFIDTVAPVLTFTSSSVKTNGRVNGNSIFTLECADNRSAEKYFAIDLAADITKQNGKIYVNQLSKSNELPINRDFTLQVLCDDGVNVVRQSKTLHLDTLPPIIKLADIQHSPLDYQMSGVDFAWLKRKIPTATWIDMAKGKYLSAAQSGRQFNYNYENGMKIKIVANDPNNGSIGKILWAETRDSNANLSPLTIYNNEDLLWNSQVGNFGDTQSRFIHVEAVDAVGNHGAYDGVAPVEENGVYRTSPVVISMSVKADYDADGVDDKSDNCKYVKNADQVVGGDSDGIGLACDNCSNVNNLDQTNSDDDNLGDACDNCSGMANNDQADTLGYCSQAKQYSGFPVNFSFNCGTACVDSVSCKSTDNADGDSRSGVCDYKIVNNAYVKTEGDKDDDFVADESDNCPSTANTVQVDSDNDGKGDACESGWSKLDHDGDGSPDYKKLITDAEWTQGTRGVACAPATTDLATGKVTPGELVSAFDAIQVCDSCPNLRNQGTDLDHDGIYDECDPIKNDPDQDGFDSTSAITVSGVNRAVDNCPSDYNPDQKNNDGDGMGDVCDSDDDNDGVGDSGDNCPLSVGLGPDQTDTDGDKIGNVCDSDDDNDGVGDSGDNCPLSVGLGPDQTDTDGDKLGNVCDADDDGDGVMDKYDNCPLSFLLGSSQLDTDGDGMGDVCDPDDDGDGVADTQDNCPKSFGLSASQADNDKDGLGDVCDADADADGVINTADNCPLSFGLGSSQLDTDGDGMGDVCDPDDDDDGIMDAQDGKCSLIANYSLSEVTLPYSDSDGDGIPSGCDPDVDGDGLPNDQDNCPSSSNPKQENYDSFGFGDYCERVSFVAGSPNVLAKPSDLVIDRDGNIQIASQDYGMIVHMTRDGKTYPTAGLGIRRMDQSKFYKDPNGTIYAIQASKITADRFGNVYFVDDKKVVRRLTSVGNYNMIEFVTEETQDIESLTTDYSGDIYLGQNNVIRKIPRNAKRNNPLSSIVISGSQVGDVEGIKIARDGRIYYISSYQLKMSDPNGNIQTLIGGGTQYLTSVGGELSAKELNSLNVKRLVLDPRSGSIFLGGPQGSLYQFSLDSQKVKYIRGDVSSSLSPVMSGTSLVGMDIDSNGKIVMALSFKAKDIDTYEGKIVSINPATSVIQTLSSKIKNEYVVNYANTLASDADLSFIGDFDMDSNNNIYLTDSVYNFDSSVGNFQGKIKKVVKSTGMIETLPTVSFMPLSHIDISEYNNLRILVTMLNPYTFLSNIALIMRPKLDSTPGYDITNILFPNNATRQLFSTLALPGFFSSAMCNVTYWDGNTNWSSGVENSPSGLATFFVFDKRFFYRLPTTEYSCADLLRIDYDPNGLRVFRDFLYAPEKSMPGVNFNSKIMAIGNGIFKDGVLIAGNEALAGESDAYYTVATDARFNNPSEMTLDPNGNLYIYDKGNATIRKIYRDPLTGGYFLTKTVLNAESDGIRLDFAAGMEFRDGYLYLNTGNSIIRTRSFKEY